jgi:hypothetical protein
METTKDFRFPFFAILLILGGAVMLLDRLSLLDVTWMGVIWILIALVGASKLWRSVGRPSRGGQFWGTVLLLGGMAMALYEFDILIIPPRLGLPLILVLLGIGTLVKFAFMPREWHLLVPALALLGVGGAMILTVYDYLPYRSLACTLGTYWPVALVVFGAALLLNRKRA